jgi:spermidine/putrescine-binding protein
MSLISNIKNAVAPPQNPSFDPGTDGKQYSIPYGYGSTAVAVRADLMDQAVTGWEVMWDPANKDIEQRLAVGVHGPGRVCVVLVPPD